MVHDKAYDEPLAATPPGWHVGKPMLHDERREWQMYAFDPSERAVQGAAQARVAIALTEEAVIRWMAYRLREIAAGRAPK